MAVKLAVALALGACGGDAADASNTSTRGTEDAGSRDSGPADGGEPPVRPPDGPRLPLAEDEVMLPYGGAVARVRIEATADLGALDVCFSVDTSNSIGQEIDALQRDLTREIIPTLQARVPDVSFGVTSFEDFPLAPYGAPRSDLGRRGDRPFFLHTPITSDEREVARAVAELDQPLGLGGDAPESSAEALWQIATGRGYEHRGVTYIEPYDGKAARGGGTEGGVGFRDHALRVVLHISDAPAHDPDSYGLDFPGTHSLEAAANALRDLDVHVLGIVSGACPDEATRGCSDTLAAQARIELEQVALHTGAVTPASRNGECPHGIDGTNIPAVDGMCPLVFDVSAEGDGLSETLTDAIVDLVDGIRFERVTAIASDDPLGFVRTITPVAVRQPAGEPPRIVDLLPQGRPDGEPDTFVDVRAAAELAFDVELQNTRIAPTDVEQRYRVIVRILGDGLIVEETTLRVVIPPGVPPTRPPGFVDAAVRDDASTHDAASLDASSEDDAGP